MSKRPNWNVVAIILTSMVVGSSYAQFQQPPIVFDHYECPVPVRANGQTVLAYELHLTSFYAQEVILVELAVFDRDRPETPIHTIEGEALRRCTMNPAAADRRATTLKLGPCQRVVLILYVPLVSDEAVPSALRHRLAIRPAASPSADQLVHAVYDEIAVSRRPVLAIGSPVRGGPWWTINVTNERVDGHRMNITYCGGQPRFPQRFGVDFVKLSDEGQAAANEGKKNTDWPGYGEQVYAVADGAVIYAQSFVVENVPFGTRRAFHGNCVWLELADGGYALYEHLQPGSVRVKAGDRVEKGQVLGLLGNSGNSDLPHLHFSLHDKPQTMCSASGPFVIEEMERLGTRTGVGLTDTWEPQSAAPQPRPNQFFQNDCVYRFGADE